MADYRVRWRGAGGWREERFQVAKNAPVGVLIRVRGPVDAIEVIPDRGPVGYRVTGVELVVVGNRSASSATASAGSR